MNTHTWRGFTFDPGDPSVGIFGTEWIHEECHYDPPFDQVPEPVEDTQLAVTRLDDMSIRTWHLLTCIECGVQALVHEDDYSPTDEFMAAEMEAERQAEEGYERWLEDGGPHAAAIAADYEAERRREEAMGVVPFDQAMAEAEAEARLAQFDDDPSPYDGTYSEC